MAQKVTVELVDDLDGTAIGEDNGRTVVFALDRRSYEIDLSAKNIEKLNEALAPFIASARPAGAASHTPAPRTRRTRGNSDLTAVREWAKQNGYPISSRGRVPANVMQAYAAAH